MKVQVVYKTVTGNTKKVAEAIYGGIDCEKDIKNLNEIKELSGFDFYFICTPIMHMGPDLQIEKFLKEKTKGKKIALAITHGSPKGFHHLTDWLKKFEDSVAGELLGMFECQGEISDAAAKFFENSGVPDLVDLARLDDSTTGKPDKEDLENAKIFAKEIVSKVK